MSLNLIYFIKYQWLFSFLCTSGEVGSCELADHGAGEKRQQELATPEVVAMNNGRRLLNCVRSERNYCM